MPVSDYCNMNCTQCRETLSAWLDGEDAPGDEHAGAHAASCAACKQWLRVAETVTKDVRTPMLTSPDLTGTILAAAQAQQLLPSPAARRHDWLRALLMLAAVAQLVFGIALLMDAHRGAAGPWNVAVGLGLLWAVAQARVRIAVLLLVAVSAGLALTRDLAIVHASAGHIASHGMAALGLLLLAAVCARRTHGPGGLQHA